MVSVKTIGRKIDFEGKYLSESTAYFLVIKNVQIFLCLVFTDTTRQRGNWIGKSVILRYTTQLNLGNGIKNKNYLVYIEYLDIIFKFNWYRLVIWEIQKISPSATLSKHFSPKIWKFQLIEPTFNLLTFQQRISDLNIPL